MVVMLDDFNQIIEGIKIYKSSFGDTDIPIKYEIPKDDQWPLSIQGLRLGKRLEKLLSTPSKC
jgi:hypothetical protein